MRATTIALLFTTTSLLGQDGISKKDFKRLQFLVGSWQLQTDPSIFERWKATSSGELEGQGFRVAADTSITETLQLIWRSGTACYVATVPNQNGGKPVEFALTGVKGERFIFENPEHDFPQRIIYHLVNKTDLEVVLDAPYAEPPGAVQQLAFKRRQ